MKKIVYSALVLIAFICTSLSAFSQAGNVTTILGSSCFNLHVNKTGNVYVSGGNRISRFDSTNTILTVVAGNGTHGSTGDGGPATSAQLNNGGGFCVDHRNNIFLTDSSNIIRMVEASTGIIRSVAGGGSSYSDGIPATNAKLDVLCIAVDNYGNLYTGGNNRIRKIDGATGMMSTVAGNGTYGNGGDGGPALSAPATIPVCITIDGNNNIYFIPTTKDRVRKIDAVTNIITTVAGGGSSYTEGAPANTVKFTGINSCSVDGAGNIYIADGVGRHVRKVDAITGRVTTIAGSGTTGSTAEGVPATSTLMTPDMIFADPVRSTIYYTDGLGRVRKFPYNTIFPHTFFAADTFYVITTEHCNGPDFFIRSYSYAPGMTVQYNYGDGTLDTIPFSPGHLGGGYATVSHSYPHAGVFTIKQTLFDGSTLVDSTAFGYNYRSFCRTIPYSIYLDFNSNCTKDPLEPYMLFPNTLAVKRNGSAIDTISATSGFYYDAHGIPGDVFTFDIVSAPFDSYVSCPISGIISDTLTTATKLPKQIGLSWRGGGGFDLQTFVSFRAGKHAAVADIIANNTHCAPQPANLLFNYSPKYNNPMTASLAPATLSASGAQWNISDLSAVLTEPVYIHVNMSRASNLPLGDTVNSEYYINPITGDANPSDNFIFHNDTVKSSYDPNFVEVSPAGCIKAGIELQYSVGFENMGNDTAHDIYVLDTLSDLIEPSSIRMLASSATVFVQKMQQFGHTVLKFDFPHIMLPDSSHKNLCHGFFVFKARTKSSIADWSLIPNRAGIYFDDNPVVMTNTATNTVGCPPAKTVNTYVNQNNVTLYPNPATDELTIKTANSSYTSLTISNSIGQVMMQQAISNTQAKVNVKALPAGLYYVTVKGENGNSVQKFVKL